MNVLMVGDIVGPDAVEYLAGRLPGLDPAPWTGGWPRSLARTPTIQLHLLPGGKALVVDIGVTGPSGSPSITSRLR